MTFHKVALAPGLTFVGVPIGTARDITLRALDVLASVDVLAAEDTRALRKLMDIHGIALDGRPLISLHDHSGAKQVARIVDMVKGGASVAYASEAGMPAVADPGFELARAMHAEGQAVTCAPGPSASTTALALAGLPTDRFLFAGFLPQAKTARQKALSEIADVQATLLFYESPKRLAASLSDMANVLGAERQAAMCRELTKKFEEIQRGTLAEQAARAAETRVKGEIVVLVERGHSSKISESDLEAEIVAALAGMSVRDAADTVAAAHGLPKRRVYQEALRLSRAADDDE